MKDVSMTQIFSLISDTIEVYIPKVIDFLIYIADSALLICDFIYARITTILMYFPLDMILQTYILRCVSLILFLFISTQFIKILFYMFSTVLHLLLTFMPFIFIMAFVLKLLS